MTNLRSNGLKSEISSIRRICLENRLNQVSGYLNRMIRGYDSLDKDIK